MCCVLQANRTTYFYETKKKQDEFVLTIAIVLFCSSRNNYGICKIKKKLVAMDMTALRGRIRRIMKQEGLVSNYTKVQFRSRKDTCDESGIINIVDRKFNGQSYRNVVVSDLIYVRVGAGWNYIRVFVEPFNHDIIGYSAGKNKTSALVKRAFQSIKENKKRFVSFILIVGMSSKIRLSKRDWKDLKSSVH